MPSKKDMLKSLFVENKDFFCCPICKKNLDIKDDSIICNNKHTFNISKKGYLYLNSINNLHNSSLYNKDLFLSRRNTLLSNLYEGVYNEIVNIIDKYNDSPISIIDIGSGEASHLYNLTKIKNFKFKLAVDLSKEAINLATDYLNENIMSSISDVENIPIKNNKIDVILDFLSPMSIKECLRVLKDEGILIKISPTSNYLKEIRTLLNQKQYSNEDNVENNILNKIAPIYQTKIEYKKEVTTELASNLFKMTPLSYHKNITSELINQLKSITISLKIYVIKKEN